MDERLPPEVPNEWLDYLLDFEHQFENAPRITVRERIGNPTIQPIDEVPLYTLEEMVNNLLDLLAEHGIAVDFMGEWEDLAAYRFLTDELLTVGMWSTLPYWMRFTRCIGLDHCFCPRQYLSDNGARTTFTLE